MAGLGDLKGLGSALPDGGKKKADPEADGDDDENDPDVRAPPNRPRRDDFDAREASRERPPVGQISSPRVPTSQDRAAFPLAHDLPPLSLFRPQFAKGVDQAEVMKALSQLGGNAGLIGALQSKLDGLVGLSSGFVESLHYQVRARVDALRNIQQSHDELREKFLEEKRALEEKYRGLYAPLYAERASIVKGEVDVDAGAPDDGEVADEEAPKGIPDFWLCALRNHEAIAEQITEKDEEALKYLVDVTCKPLEPVAPEEPEEEEEEEARGFTIDFHFEQPNPFFTNAVLSKSYHMVDEEDPILEFSEGTEIDWLPGKNLCVKVLRKKPKKGVKNAKPITKTERCESFFNFFPPGDSRTTPTSTRRRSNSSRTPWRWTTRSAPSSRRRSSPTPCPGSPARRTRVTTQRATAITTTKRTRRTTRTRASTRRTTTTRTRTTKRRRRERRGRPRATTGRNPGVQAAVRISEEIERSEAREREYTRRYSR